MHKNYKKMDVKKKNNFEIHLKINVFLKIKFLIFTHAIFFNSAISNYDF